ncbi:unnamed protein product [Parnassius apollo]|uniref:(apollo) hypothetical protein n=1 Tax=Parnassius apollo TaxID=110799 RepID=A0A8S3WD23_PARAO|nr:unnamed protein product [Parnassius apollo]
MPSKTVGPSKSGSLLEVYRRIRSRCRLPGHRRMPPSRPGSCPSDKDATGEISGSEGVTSASASASSGTAITSDYSGTTTTEDTTTTETTVATATTAASEDNGQKDEAAQ